MNRIGWQGIGGVRANFVFAAALAALAFFAAAAAQAQSLVPRESVWTPNGPVKTVARNSSSVFIGGEFTWIGPNTGCGAPLDLAAGTVLPPYPRVGSTTQHSSGRGVVYACVSDGAGGWYIGGNFDLVGGKVRKNLAHILPNGATDPAWIANANGTVHALSRSAGGVLFAGGEFTQIGSSARMRIAALGSAGAPLAGWAPSVDNGRVRCLALSPDGNTLYAGGSFTMCNSASRNRLASFSASSGSLQSWNPGADGEVRGLAVRPTGTTVYAGGLFLNAGGQPRSRIAALDATSALATAWDPNANDDVYTLTMTPSGTLYAGGRFTRIGGADRNALAALTIAGTGGNAALAWNPNLGAGTATAYVYAICVVPAAGGQSPERIFAGGWLRTAGGLDRRNAAAFLAESGAPTTWDPQAESTVTAIAAHADRSAIYVGGLFFSLGGLARQNLAALNASSGAGRSGWAADCKYANNAVSGVDKLALSPDGATLYVAGRFDRIGTAERRRLAAVNASTAALTAWNPAPYSASGTKVNDIALSADGQRLYLVGRFNEIGGQTGLGVHGILACVSTATGNMLTGWTRKSNLDWNIDFYAVQPTPNEQNVLAAGNFTQIEARTGYKGLAAFGMDEGSPFEWRPAAENPVEAHKILYAPGAQPYVYVAGPFTTIMGMPRQRIAKITAPDDMILESWNPGANGAPQSLALSPDGKTLYVGGNFSQIGGQARLNLAALKTFSPPGSYCRGWNPAPDAPVAALALKVDGSRIEVGGNFKTISGDCRPYFAEYDIAIHTAAEHWTGY